MRKWQRKMHVAVYYRILDLAQTPRQPCEDGCIIISGYHKNKLNGYSKWL